MAIYNTSGTVVAEYEYDAWGRVLSATDKTDLAIAEINPFRYRSYYYDTETELYYLETRYYDPKLGRFLNPDTLDYLGDGEDLHNYNLFSYCSNNPVMYSDPTGHSLFPNWAKWLIGGGLIFLLVEVTSYSQTNAAMHAKLDWIITQNANCTKAVVGLAGMLARLFSHF